MMRASDLIATIARLDERDLESWISEDLIAPEPDPEGPAFSDVECARVRLICTLRYELEIEADALPLIVSLIDQLYDTRRQLLSLTAALAAQDAGVQRAVFAALRPPVVSHDTDAPETP